MIKIFDILSIMFLILLFSCSLESENSGFNSVHNDIKESILRKEVIDSNYNIQVDNACYSTFLNKIGLDSVTTKKSLRLLYEDLERYNYSDYIISDVRNDSFETEYFIILVSSLCIVENDKHFVITYMGLLDLNNSIKGVSAGYLINQNNLRCRDLIELNKKYINNIRFKYKRSSCF